MDNTHEFEESQSYADREEVILDDGVGEGYLLEDYDKFEDSDSLEESEELEAPLWKYFPAGSEERELHRD